MIDMNGIVGIKYEEVVLRIRRYALHRRADDVGASNVGTYGAMIGHDCSAYNPPKYYLRNGERDPMCSSCGEYVPDEIWGLWQMMCNDQRQRSTYTARKT